MPSAPRTKPMPLALQQFPLSQPYTTLPKHAFAHSQPTASAAPNLVIYNHRLATELGIALEALNDDGKAQLFSGNHVPKDCQPVALAYAGHQYGHFTMLGDGRAHLLGAHQTTSGQSYDVQLKGSGKTPFSRHGDGRAALGPMLREYLISEAMSALNIPTTRSLAVVASGEPVLRETALPGAILTRVAASHMRVGSFEYFAAQRDSSGLRALADMAIERHNPELRGSDTPYLSLLKSVIEQQAHLMTEWLRVGFVHGVMNTDNMTICGETIDYGPCAFMDHYDPNTVFSSIDEFGRYSFANQPSIAQWNLSRLAEAMLPLFDENIERAASKAEDALLGFAQHFQREWIAMMRRKLGFSGEFSEDETLIKDWLQWLQRHAQDYTNSFRALMAPSLPSHDAYRSPDFESWYSRWRARRGDDDATSLTLMRAANPAIIPRNHLVQTALDNAEEQADYSAFYALHEALSKPYHDTSDKRTYQNPPLPNERVYQTFCGT